MATGDDTVSEALRWALQLARPSAATVPSARWDRRELTVPWDDGPELVVVHYSEPLHFHHQISNHLLVTWAGRTWIAQAPGEGHTVGPRPSSAPHAMGELPALRCPPLDGSWPAPDAPTTGSTAARLAAEQAAGRFAPTSLRDELTDWVFGLARDELQSALGLLHAIAFWPPSGSHAFDAGEVFADYHALRDDIRRDLEACEVLERNDIVSDYQDRFVAPGPLPRGPIVADASGFIWRRHQHDGESDGWTEQVYLVRLRCRSSRSPGRRRPLRHWSLRRNLIWRHRHLGDALS